MESWIPFFVVHNPNFNLAMSPKMSLLWRRGPTATNSTTVLTDERPSRQLWACIPTTYQGHRPRNIEHWHWKYSTLSILILQACRQDLPRILIQIVNFLAVIWQKTANAATCWTEFCATVCQTEVGRLYHSKSRRKVGCIEWLICSLPGVMIETET